MLIGIFKQNFIYFLLYLTCYEKNNFSFFAIFISISFSAQKEVVLRINHALNGTPFKYNENFNISGNTNYFTRLQYYLSGIVINHDGSQSTSLSNVYVLASGHITNYPLGNFSFNQIESISFNVGVDQIANSGNTVNFSTSFRSSKSSNGLGLVLWLFLCF